VTALIGALRVSLSADTANFEAGMRRAQGTANSSAASINKSLSTVKAGLAGFASAFTVGLLTKAIGNALEYAGSLGEVSQQLGVTTKDLQTFRFIAGQVGVSQEQLETGLSKLTITMGKVAAGAKAPTDALRAIGISADQLKGKDTGEAFRMIADGLQKVTDRSQRAAVEVALFGKSGAMLDNMLSGGSGQINELSAAAEKLGIVLSDAEIQHADETADKLRAVKTVLEAQIAGVVAKNADSILALASSLGSLSGEIVKFLSTNPQLALGIIGALLGGRVGGLPGAAIGAVGGAALGSKLAQNMANSNTDVKFRRQEFVKAETAFQRARKQGDTGNRAMPGVGVALNDVAGLKKERDRQAKMFFDAVVASKRKPAPTGGTNITPFLATGGGGGGGKHGGGGSAKPKADHSAEDALRDDHQFGNELRSAQMDVLQARRDLAHSSSEQAALDLQMLDLRKQDNDSELAYQVELNKLTDGKQGLTEEQAKQLKIEYDRTDALKREALAEDLAAKSARDRAELQDNAYSLQVEELQLQDDLATTAKDRRDAELRILDVMKQQEKARLEAVLADKQSSDLAKQEAQQRLDHLDSIYAGRAQSVMNQTRGPLENYLEGIPHTVEQTQEALQNLEVRGLDGLATALSHVGEGWKSMRDIALQTIQDILQALIKMQIEKMFFSLLGSAAGGGFGGGSAGLGGVGGGLSFGTDFSSIPVTGFANGGSGVFGGLGGIDKNLLSLNGLPIAKVSKGEPFAIGHQLAHAAGGPPVTIHVHGAMSAAEARKTGTQIYSGWSAEQARARGKGI
jgi:hypothetical protein